MEELLGKENTNPFEQELDEETKVPEHCNS